MKKTSLSLLALFVCMVLASCGGSSAELTGKGVFGDIPQYLLKCYEMNKQYADELEFEDNNSNRYKIEDKYNDLWAHYKNDDFKIVQKINDFRQHPVSVAGGEEYGIKDAIIDIENHNISLNSKQSITLNVEMRPETLPSKATCLFLDEKDSVIFSAAVITNGRQGKATASIRFRNFTPENAQQRDYLKFSIYMLDRIKTIKLVTGDEVNTSLEGLKGNMDALIKTLHEAGVLECASLEEMVNGNYASKQSGDGEETEEADKNKPGKADLAYFGLRGAVKSFTEYRHETLVYKNTFTENGKWETIDGNKLGNNYSDIKRDSEKRIVGFTDGEYGSQSTYAITYDEKTGWVTKLSIQDADGGSTAVTYTYDENGNVVKEVTNATYIEMGADEPTKVNTTTTYKIVDTDSHGNWTKRSAKCSDDSYWEEKRTISYYN